MKVIMFSTRPYDRAFVDKANTSNEITIDYLETRLTEETVSLAKGYQGICVFTNDVVNGTVIAKLAEYGIALIALRCAGYNNIDLQSASAHSITVVRVPEYSPYAVAEHTIALILGLNRHLHKAYNRVREGNFSLNGLMGFDLHGKTVGIIGTGKIGRITANILSGFGCHILAYDPYPNDELASQGAHYAPLDEVLQQADVVSLHCPLTPQSYHLINQTSLQQMKSGAMLINTSRGGLIDTSAVIDALKSGHLGSLGIDVYEEEGDLFFENLSDTVIQDDIFSRLLTFPNVMITGHQAFFTHEAMTNIADTTVANIQAFSSGKPQHTVS